MNVIDDAREKCRLGSGQLSLLAPEKVVALRPALIALIVIFRCLVHRSSATEAMASSEYCAAFRRSLIRRCTNGLRATPSRR
jgi:hypothetical protein